MLRETASSAPGVDLLLSLKATDLLLKDGRLAGVLARGADGSVREIPGRLTIGADGRNSVVAAKSGLRVSTTAHGRFGYFAYYAGSTSG